MLISFYGQMDYLIVLNIVGNNFTQNTSLASLLTKDNVLFGVQVLTLFFLILYVKKTWDIASATRYATRISEKTLLEMKETREQENAPYIVIYCENSVPYDTDLYLIVKNSGKSIAEDVKLDFTPHLCSASEC